MMRRFLGVAAAAAALALAACETADNQRRQSARPPPAGETRPMDSSPMRGDESYPVEDPYPGSEAPSGSQLDRGSSVPPVTAGRRSLNDSTVRAQSGIPPGLGGETYADPYALAARKSPRDAGAMGELDAGSHYQSSPPANEVF